MPQTQGSCAQPNWVQRVGIAAQAWVAPLTGLNIGVGIGGSAGAGIGAGVGYGASRQMVVSPNGQAAIVTTFSSAGGPYNFFGPVLGVGALGGLQLSIGSATGRVGTSSRASLVARRARAPGQAVTGSR